MLKQSFLSLTRLTDNLGVLHGVYSCAMHRTIGKTHADEWTHMHTYAALRKIEVSEALNTHLVVRHVTAHVDAHVK